MLDHQDNQVPLVNLEVKANLVKEDVQAIKDNKAQQEPQGSEASQGGQVKEVQGGQLEDPDNQDLLVHQAHLVNREDKGSLVFQEVQEPQAQEESKVKEEHLDSLEHLAALEDLDQMVSQALMGNKDQEEHQESRVNRVRLVELVDQENKDKEDQQDLKVKVVSLVLKASQAQEELEADQASLDHQARPGNKVDLDNQGDQAAEAQQVPLESKVTKDQLEHRDQQVLLVCQAHKGVHLQAHGVSRENQEHRVNLGHLDHQVDLVPKELKEGKGSKENRDHKVGQVGQVALDLLDLQVRRDRRVKLVRGVQ